MKREVRTERILIDKKDLDKMLKKYEFYQFCEQTCKITDILGFTTAAAGLLAKSWVIGGIGLGLVALSRAGKALVQKASKENKQNLESMQGKSVSFIRKEEKQSTNDQDSQDLTQD